jgi:NAD dependent epimerase/dehydratase
MRTRRILVTGADGFIGSHLTEALVRRGDTVRAFVLYNSFNSRGWLDEAPCEVQREIEFFVSDVRDAGAVRNAVDGCDTVLHLAALISIPYSFEAPESFVQTNILGTMNVLNAALATQGARVVQTSTSEVYGTAQFVPITEQHPLQAQSPYAATKIAADQLALSYYRAYGLPVSVLRPFNTYGPRQSARAVIPTIINQLLAGERCIRLGALHPTRDFNHVADIVRAFLAMADARQVVGEVVNVSTNHEISIAETAREIAATLRVDATIESDPTRIRPVASEVERLCADNAKAMRLLGWTPEYAGIEGFRRGLAETVEWFRRRGPQMTDKALSYTI